MLLLNPHRFALLYNLIFDAARKDTNIDILNSNKSILSGSTTFTSCVCTVGRSSGKYQVEFVLTGGRDVVGGLALTSFTQLGGYLGQQTSPAAVGSAGLHFASGTFYEYLDAGYSSEGGGGAFLVDDVVGLTVDMTTAGSVTYRFYKNGVAIGAAPTTVTGISGDIFPAASAHNSNLITVRGRGLQYPVAGFTAWDGANTPYIPENEPATLAFNPYRKAKVITLSNSDKTATGADATWKTVTAVRKKSSGKWQAEFVIDGASTSLVGLAGPSYDSYNSTYLGQVASSIGYWANGHIYAGGFTGEGAASSYVAGDVIGITVDFTTASTIKVRFYKNGVLTGSEISGSSSDLKWALAASLQSPTNVTLRGTGLQYPVAGFTAWDD